jgi:hemerythrin
MLLCLAQYTEIHFKAEEALMAEASYTAIKEYSFLHKTLIEKTKKLCIEVSRDKEHRPGFEISKRMVFRLYR